MHRHPPQPHPVTPVSVNSQAKSSSKKRGSYNCGRCGLPKKGHVCNLTITDDPNTTTPIETSASSIVTPSLSVVRTPPLRQPSHLRRALSFEDIDVEDSLKGGDDDEDEKDVVLLDVESDVVDVGRSGKLPASCLWEVMRRLPPSGLMLASGVCKGWRDTAKMLWRAAEELRLTVPAKSQIGFVGSVLQKCPSLVRLSLIMESDMDSTTLACIAFSCPNLEFLEIFTSSTSVNRITGEALSRFVTERRCLTSLIVEGCSNLGGLVLSSTTLSTLKLSNLYSLSKMIFNCPNLNEISLDFSRQENDNTNLTTMVDCLGRNCPRLESIHIASSRLSHSVALALRAANFRELRILSLVLGSELTDASVAAIASSYSNLESLDLSGSSISDSGIGMICNVFPDTLSSLLLSLCPNITSSGIQFAAAQLPLLELLDCGMTICDPNLENEGEIKKTQHLIYQKLIIKHTQLKKLSLWGCSGLDALYLNCPKLADLNLNWCSNLHPERLLLQCPNLESVHASNCQDMLVDTIKSQVCIGLSSMENHFPYKRLSDGSKRIRVPLFGPQQSEEGGNKKRKVTKPACSVFVN